MQQIKKAVQPVEKKPQTKQPHLSNFQQQVKNALEEVVKNLEGDLKTQGSSVGFSKAVEIPNGKEKPTILVYLTYRSHKALLTQVYKKLANELEKKLKTTVLLVSSRSIHSRWVKKNRTQKRPNSKTLSAVYDALLDELILPGIIIGKSTRVRLDGTSFTRITLDKSIQDFLEDRVQAIVNTYKRLTTRDITVEFQKENVYYSLKKGEGPK